MGSKGDYVHQKTIDPALFKLLGNLEGSQIYDIGCGNGYLDVMMVEKGANKVFASDISTELVNIAREIHHRDEIEYFIASGGNFKAISDNSLDRIVLNMSIHYIENIHELAKNSYKKLKTGGSLVFSTSHPFHSMRLFKPTTTLESAIKKAEAYLTETVKTADWKGGSEFKIYKYPLSQFINTFSQEGLACTGMEEMKTNKPDGNGSYYKSPIPSHYCMRFTKNT